MPGGLNDVARRRCENPRALQGKDRRDKGLEGGLAWHVQEQEGVREAGAST